MDPALVAQVHGAVRSMVAACRASVVPWLREQLAEQAAAIARASLDARPLDARALAAVESNPFMAYSTPHQYAYAASSSSGHGSQFAGPMAVAGGSGASPTLAGARHMRKRSSDMRDARVGSANANLASSSHYNGGGGGNNLAMQRSSTASPGPGAGPNSSNSGGGGSDAYRTLERLCRAGDTQALADAINEALVSAPDAAAAWLGPQGRARSSLLHVAASLRRPDMCAVLVNLGANPNLVNARGVTPVLVALDAGDAGSARAMAERGGRLPRQELAAVEARLGRALDSELTADLLAPPVDNAAWDAENAANPPLSFSRPPTSMTGAAAGAGGVAGSASPQLGASANNTAGTNSAAAAAAAAAGGVSAEYARSVLMTVPPTKPADATEKQVGKMLDKLVRFGDQATLKTFLDSLSTGERLLHTGPTGHSKSTLLFTAAWNKRSDLFDLLIAGVGVDVNHRNLRRNTALLMSVEQGDMDAVALLLQYGAYATERDLKELEARTGHGCDPAIVALLMDNYKSRKAMGEFDKVKDEKATVTASNVKKALAALSPEKSAFRQDIHKELERHVKFGDPAKVRGMLEALPQASRDAHLGPVGMSKSTLLFTAAWHRRADMCRVLVECGADVTHRNVRQNSAVSMAIEQHSLETVEALLETGADSSAQEVREIEKRTNKPVPEQITDAIFDWCGK